jgi:hypothetical protein
MAERIFPRIFTSLASLASAVSIASVVSVASVVLVALALLTACGGPTTDASTADLADAATLSPSTSDAGGGVTNVDASSNPLGQDSGARGNADAGAGVAAAQLDYDHDGAEPFSTSSATLTNAGRTFTENIYMPTSAGAHPAVSISPGLLQTSAAYAPFATRLASYGIAVLIRDDPGALTVTTDVEADVEYAVGTWMPTALAGKVDLTRVGLAGHSRGGKTTLLAAERGLKGKVVAWFGLDPVDTSALSGGAQARDTLATIGIPTVYLAAQVSSTCSPAADSSDMLFGLSPSPSVKIVAVNAGHTELQDQSACTECSLCTPAGTADPAVVLAYAVRYLAAFFARELLQATNVGATFEKVGAPADVAANRILLDAK